MTSTFFVTRVYAACGGGVGSTFNSGHRASLRDATLSDRCRQDRVACGGLAATVVGNRRIAGPSDRRGDGQQSCYCLACLPR